MAIERKWIVVAGLGAVAAAVWFMARPSTYDECILKHMPGTAHIAAASAIVEACERQFGSPPAR